MSRRALEHNKAVRAMKLASLMARGLTVPEPPAPGQEPPNSLPVFGNQLTMNMHNILHSNILDSEYFQMRCAELVQFNEIVDEIYNEVKYVEPFVPGGHNAPSTAFCLLFTLFCRRVTEKQIVTMLDHPDSPFIRAIGFLYIRYTAQPDQLLDWFWDYLNDQEMIKPKLSANSTTMPMGKYVRSLLLEQTYFETRLPKLPLSLEKMIQDELDGYPFVLEQNPDDVVDPTVDLQLQHQPQGKGSSSAKVEARKLSPRRSPSPRRKSRSPRRSRSRSPRKHSHRREKSRSRSPRKHRTRSKSPRRRRSRSPEHKSKRDRRSRSRSPREKSHKSKSRHRSSSRSPSRK